MEQIKMCYSIVWKRCNCVIHMIFQLVAQVSISVSTSGASSVSIHHTIPFCFHLHLWPTLYGISIGQTMDKIMLY